MAEEKVVNLKINSNVVETTKDVEALNSALDNTTKEVDNVNKSGQGTSKLASGFNKAGDAVEALQPGLKGAVSGMKAMLVQMWAIVANPIGLVVVAIVGALTLLYKAFASTNDGADKLEQVMAGLSAVIDIVRDRILVVGNAIVKFFQGDFKGALAEGKKAVSGFGAEVEREFKQASNAAKSLQEVEDAMRSISVSRAKLDRDLAKSKELLTDENATYAQKVKALKEIKEAEGKQTAQELANAQKKYDAIKLQNSLSDTSDEDLDKEAAAEAELYKIQQKSAEDNRSINKQEKRAHADEMTRIKQISDARKQAAKELADEKKRIDDELTKSIQENARKLKEIEDARVYEANNADTQLSAIASANQARMDAEMKAKGDYAAWELNLIRFNADQEKIIRDKQIEDEKVAAQARFDIQQSTFDTIENGIGVLKAAFEKNKALQKVALIAESAFGIARIIINTKAANAAARLKYALIPGGFALAAAEATVNNISAGVGIAANLVATAKGLSALGTGGAPSGGSNLGSEGSGATSSAPQFNVVGTSGVNQIAQVVNKEQPIVKAYVVASDVTTAQSLDRNIIKSSTLG